MVEFQAVVSAIQSRSPTKWLTHEHVFAAELGLEAGASFSPVDVLNGFVDSIRDGGSGVRSHNTYRPNPAPFNVKIDLSVMATNRLRCNYVIHAGNKAIKKEDVVELTGPSPLSLSQPAKFYHTGKVNGLPSLKDQLDIARYCIGTHKFFDTSCQEMGKRRRELVELWIAGDPKGRRYEQLDLPILATYFCEHPSVHSLNLTCPVSSRMTN